MRRSTIGAELAQVFARFGVQVTMVEALPRLLPSSGEQCHLADTRCV